MDVALEKLIARTEGARRRRRISQVKGQSKEGGPRWASPVFFVFCLSWTAPPRGRLFFAPRAPGPGIRNTIGKLGNERGNKHGATAERFCQRSERRALEQAAALAVFAAGHRHLLYRPHPVHPGARLWRGAAPGLRR